MIPWHLEAWDIFVHEIQAHHLLYRVRTALLYYIFLPTLPNLLKESKSKVVRKQGGRTYSLTLINLPAVLCSLLLFSVTFFQ